MKLRFEHPAWHRWLPVWAEKLTHLYFRTCSFSLRVHPESRELLASGRPVVGTCWHGQLLPVLYFFSPLDKARNYYARLSPLILLASPSRDGELVAEVAQRWGVTVCRGSRQKGGARALQEMATYLRQGRRAALVADGSRGPARVAQKGLLFLAREAQVPILPVAMAASRKMVFHTWDRFELPWPFSRIALLVGRPLWVAPDVRGAKLEPLRQQLQLCLNELCAAAEVMARS